MCIYLDKCMHTEGVFLRAKIEFIIAVIILAGLWFLNQNITEKVTATTAEEKMRIVIDAGHGGEDPGKIAVNGALEKEINLSVAKKLKLLLEEQGIEVKMVREEDKMLSSESAKNKKMEDMKARVKLINHSVPALVVSIHQNSFSDASAKGAQVFYHAESKEGKTASEIMQKNLKEIDTDNHRQAKGNDDYYLLKHTEVPVIIVECGFLSNPEEAELLIKEEYQNKLADVMSKGIVEYLERK